MYIYNIYIYIYIYIYTVTTMIKKRLVGVIILIGKSLEDNWIKQKY